MRGSPGWATARGDPTRLLQVKVAHIPHEAAIAQLDGAVAVASMDASTRVPVPDVECSETPYRVRIFLTTALSASYMAPERNVGIGIELRAARGGGSHVNIFQNPYDGRSDHEVLRQRASA